jgi:hypothetical protein
MSRLNGWLQLRRGFWEHVRDGRMSVTEALAFVYICSEADTRTGIWKGSAKSLSGELNIRDRTARDVLERMERGDYIRRFPVPGRHVCYPILVHKYLITSGEHDGEQLNALDSKSPADLAYIPREHDSERNGEHDGEHGASQKRSRTKKREEKEPTPRFALPDWIPQPAWDDFLAMRKSLRASPTEKAKALTVKRLERMRIDGQDVRAVLEQSIERSWKGVFEVKEPQGKAGTNGTAEQRNDNIRGIAQALASKFGTDDFN